MRLIGINTEKAFTGETVFEFAIECMECERKDIVLHLEDRLIELLYAPWREGIMKKTRNGPHARAKRLSDADETKVGEK